MRSLTGSTRSSRCSTSISTTRTTCCCSSSPAARGISRESARHRPTGRDMARPRGQRALAVTAPEETPDQYGAYPRLEEAQLQRLAAAGERAPAGEGDVLFREGDDPYDFVVVLSGKVALTHDGERIAGHGPRRFLGELGLLDGQPALFTATVVESGEVLRLDVVQVRELVAQDPSFGDVVLRAFLQRRDLLIGLGAGVKVVGSCYSRDTRRLLEFLARNRLPYRWIDVEEDASAEALLRRLGVGTEETPVVVWHGDVLRNPSNAELARVL